MPMLCTVTIAAGATSASLGPMFVAPMPKLTRSCQRPSWISRSLIISAVSSLLLYTYWVTSTMSRPDYWKCCWRDDGLCHVRGCDQVLHSPRVLDHDDVRRQVQHLKQIRLKVVARRLSHSHLEKCPIDGGIETIVAP